MTFKQKLSSTLIVSLFSLGSISLQAKDKDTRSGVISVLSIMEETHDGENSLGNKVIRGEATEKEMHELIAVYKALYTLDPPRGKSKPWKKKIAKIVKTAAQLQEDENLTDTTQLAKVMDCKSCHKAHQPKDKFNDE